LRLTIRHHFDFGSERPLVGDRLDSAASWDALRLRTSGPFALPASRDEWERRAAGDVVRHRAEAADMVLRRWGARRVASYGVGAAALELCLALRRPDLELVLADYAPETVGRLRELFDAAVVTVHDLRADGPLAADAHLLSRVDSELDDGQLREVFVRFADERVLFVATEILGVRSLLREARTRLRGNATAAGWVRSRGSLEELWSATHDARRVVVHDLAGWALEPRRPT